MICYGYRWQLRVLARAPTASDHKHPQTFTAKKVIQQPLKTAFRAHLDRFISNFWLYRPYFLLKNNRRKFEMD